MNVDISLGGNLPRFGTDTKNVPHTNLHTTEYIQF